MTPAINEKGNRAEGVLQALENMIFTGELQPRERLVVSALTGRLGVSAYSIRTALQAMEAKGLVRMEPHRGAMVSDLAPKEIDEIFAVRVGLEKMANRMAVAHVTQEDIAQLNEIDAQLQAGYHQGELSKVIAANAKFHNHVAGLSRNQTLIKMILELKKRCHIFNTTAWSSPEIVDRLFEEHRQYIQALRDKDPDLLEDLPERHFGHSKDLYLQRIKAKQANMS
ncbi:MAG: GntR family transcriptional regulator [Proteobacteria bacterium]|nr:GntR family transcriptional regulator [Pseudomonadota bacterium]MBU1452132.1 GntR family transcriptional regulator [Pseudomonadota bacterium]MBU2467527.1 GntR family transcriptional regulator [Pseudomonadota bacterium]MBU2517932.1 GntR family transcriptional regulator [Pseudomonadota bacterium]